MSLYKEPTMAEYNIWYFKRFLQALIEGNEKYSELVIPVIQEAQDYLKGAKGVYQVDRVNYHEIMFVVEHAKELVLSFDMPNLNKDDLTNLAIALSTL